MYHLDSNAGHIRRIFSDDTSFVFYEKLKFKSPILTATEESDLEENVSIASSNGLSPISITSLDFSRSQICETAIILNYNDTCPTTSK